jgi:hypothetical protein
MPRFNVERSYKYRYRGNEVDTPDILVKDAGQIAVVIECKATKLSYGAQFADDPIGEAKSAYGEIAKGVFQLWRYFSHARRGIVAGDRVRPDAHGIVLTLDTWLMLSRLREYVITTATELAESDPDIITEDRRNVVFCSIQELEETLNRSDEDTFFGTLSAARKQHFVGWQLPNIDREIHKGPRNQKGYPFKLGEVLPWWDVVEQLRRDAAAESESALNGDSRSKPLSD